MEVIAAIGGAVSLVNKAGEALGGLTDFLGGQGRHNLSKGIVEAGNILLYEEQFRPSYEMLGRRTHVFEYNGNKVITAVVAKDNWDDDTGGDPEIISGGPGQKHVKVKVTSQFNRGFDHTVYVYGKK
ncbi:uncharacterized protein LOC144644906 [Oculina patagonica]